MVKSKNPEEIGLGLLASGELVGLTNDDPENEHIHLNALLLADLEQCASSRRRTPSELLRAFFRILVSMETFFADIRQALRMLRKSPAFTLVAVSALALGIGANTAIFSVVNKVLLQSLPYPEPDRLVRLARHFTQNGGGDGYSISIPKYMAWRNNNSFASMALYSQGSSGLNLSGGDRPQQVKGSRVSLDYFKVFGVSPMIGRTFTSSEDLPNGPQAVVISEALWKSKFAGDPSIVGKSLILDGASYPIVGVLPASFTPDDPTDLWVPLQADPLSTNQGHYLAVAGRLKPGITLSEARAEMKLAGERFRRANPKWMDKGESVAAIPMRDALVHEIKPALFILLGAVALVLLIACANVANLLLARAAGRHRELAIRAALGASRSRVIRQLLTESILLAVLGGLLGLLLGAWGVRSLLLLVPGDIPRLTTSDHADSLVTLLDWRVAAFTIGISLLTGILFGLFPALQISKPDVASTLKEASGRSVTGRRQNRIRKLLVAGELALALVLLTSAVLLIKTFVGLTTVNAGIDPHHVLTFQTALAGDRYSSSEKIDNFVIQVTRRLETVPGVEAAAGAVAIPTGTQIDLPFNIVGRSPKAGEIFIGDEQWRSVSPRYFAAFKVPLTRGRYFNDRDIGNSAPVVVVNQSFAKHYWPKENPIGQVLVIGKGLGPQFDDPPRQVIGVVGDIRETSLSDDNLGVMYLPLSQVPQGMTNLISSVLPLSWIVRSHLDPASLRAVIQKEISAIDGQMPIANVKTMDEVLAKSTTRQNFNMLLLTIFAGVALALAAIGVYGLMSYSVEQQSQELGIRIALGAARRDVLRLIVKQGMTPALLGVIAGLAIAFGVTRLLAGLLYGVKATDPLSFASVALVLTAVALLATCIPALRAAKVDPLVALREE